LIAREKVVEVARSWIGTPYHLAQRVKGAGVDCALLLVAIYQECGIVPADEPGHTLSDDWFCHTDEDKYLFRALRHAHKTMEGVTARSLAALPGNLALTKVAGSRVYNHGGIVTRWPLVIHASTNGVAEVDTLRDPEWVCRHVVILDPWSVAE
jgi:cell wall-associated NlpC family hydrolase